jgi:hypothetical protein
MSEESRAREYRRMMTARCDWDPGLNGSASAYQAALERTRTFASGAEGWTWVPPCEVEWDDPRQVQRP